MAGIWPIKEYHRDLLAGESGSVKKEPGGRLNTVILYPNTYRVGMANLGLAVVYGLLNRRGDALCERAFLPDATSRPLYESSRAPLLSLESSRPVADFDLVLVTLSFENDAVNLAAMLEHAGLGLDAGSRQGPLVVVGGVAAMLNPEPYAQMADGLLLGEAEAVLENFIDSLLELGGLPRDELLLALAQGVEGFYAPRFYTPGYGPDGVLTSFEPSADVPARIKAPKYQGPAQGLAKSIFKAQGPEFGDMTLIEVGRGCPRGCRFCAAGHVLRPPPPGSGRRFPGSGAGRSGRWGQGGAGVGGGE